MNLETRTEGILITGIKARWYDIAQFFDGAYLIYRRMVKSIKLRPGDKVLDIGCGTGNVLLRLYKQYGDSVTFYGIDPSRDMINIAVRKSRGRNRNIQFIVAAGEHLLFDNETLDWVISSLALHHMPRHIKAKVIEEMWRVLKPNGRVLISDFGKPHGLLSRLLVAIIRRFDFAPYSFLVENLQGVVEEILKESRFKSVETASVQFGFIEHIVAIK